MRSPGRNTATGRLGSATAVGSLPQSTPVSLSPLEPLINTGSAEIKGETRPLRVHKPIERHPCNYRAPPRATEVSTTPARKIAGGRSPRSNGTYPGRTTTSTQTPSAQPMTHKFNQYPRCVLRQLATRATTIANTAMYNR